MIARLSGTLVFSEGNSLVIDVNGVGYGVAVPVTVLAEIGDVGSSVTLHTHLNVREDELSLYGFSTRHQLKAFETLISVSGIGPKVALAILSAIDVGSLANAVTAGDTRTLIKIPGLGLKTAQRLILELRDKMASLSIETRAAAQTTARSGDPLLQTAGEFESDIADALVGLGYNRKDAERAASRALNDAAPGERPTSAKALRDALNVLTGNR